MSISKIKRGRLANYTSTPIFDRITAQSVQLCKTTAVARGLLLKVKLKASVLKCTKVYKCDFYSIKQTVRVF
jgi:hypothetical protein